MVVTLVFVQLPVPSWGSARLHPCHSLTTLVLVNGEPIGVPGGKLAGGQVGAVVMATAPPALTRRQRRETTMTKYPCALHFVKLGGAKSQRGEL